MKDDSKIKKTKKTRPKYNMLQNTAFMIGLAWTSKEKKVLVSLLLAASLTAALSILNLYLPPTVLSVVEQGEPVSKLLLTVGGFSIVLMIVSAVNAYIDTNSMYGRISVRSELINALNRKVTTTSYPNLFDERMRELENISTAAISNNSAATEAIWGTLTSLLSNVIGFVVYACLLSSVQPAIAVFITITAMIGFFVSFRLNEWGYRHRAEESVEVGKMDYLKRISSGVTFAKDIRIFGLRSWIEELYTKAERAYTAFHERAEGVYAIAGAVDVALTFLRNAVAYAILVGLVVKGRIGVAEFLLYFSAVDGFAAWVNGILGELNTLHKHSLDICNVRELLDYDEPFELVGGEHIKADPMGAYEIRLERVSFRYPGADKDTLTNIDLTLHPGEKLAVVGLNGAGKTTLIKLICGFLDPTEGRVLLNGRDVREFNRVDYYTLFSAVFQNFSLLAASIAANVAQDTVDIDLDRVKYCVERAGLCEKIESLAAGYDTLLNREVYDDAILLSGGETQRLMLARALYKDAPFIILDEPTAALDPIAEADMYNKYNEMTNRRSSVYISHRLASTRFCDRIILIDGAKISETGTHDELIKMGGKYAELFEVQSKYYKNEEGEGYETNETNETNE